MDCVDTPGLYCTQNSSCAFSGHFAGAGFPEFEEEHRIRLVRTRQCSLAHDPWLHGTLASVGKSDPVLACCPREAGENGLCSSHADGTSEAVGGLVPRCRRPVPRELLGRDSRGCGRAGGASHYDVIGEWPVRLCPRQ